MVLSTNNKLLVERTGFSQIRCYWLRPNNTYLIRTNIQHKKLNGTKMMSSGSTSVKVATPEDEFYNNLTLNLIQFFNNIPRIKSVTLHKQQPSEMGTTAQWEQRHNVYLPEDMKR